MPANTLAWKAGIHFFMSDDWMPVGMGMTAERRRSHIAP